MRAMIANLILALVLVCLCARNGVYAYRQNSVPRSLSSPRPSSPRDFSKSHSRSEHFHDQYHKRGMPSTLRAIPLNQQGSVPGPNTVSSRVQRIKDLSAQREILKDITAAEFALKLEVADSQTQIDYDSLISKLEYHLEKLKQKVGASETDISLIDRIQSTREELTSAKIAKAAHYDADGVDRTIDNDTSDKQNELDSATAVEKTERDDGGLRLLLREDGTVDWDGAIESSREVAKFGKELWVRLNGRDVENTQLEVFGHAQPSVPVTNEIEKMQSNVDRAQKLVAENVIIRDSLKSKLREIRKQGKPMSADDLRELRTVDIRTKVLQKRLRISSVDLDMERICSYLQQEIESSIDAPDLRRLVAEVGLIDKQIQGLISGYQFVDESTAALEFEQRSTDEKTDATVHGVTTADELIRNSGLISLIDDDELNFICAEVSDLKARLGLSPQSGKPMDWGTLVSLLDKNNEQYMSYTYIRTYEHTNMYTYTYA